jgi:hypothetical protein
VIRYTDKLLDKLTLDVTGGYIPIDINLAEHATRHLSRARKTANTQIALRVIANTMIYTLIEMAKANQLVPRQYRE